MAAHGCGPRPGRPVCPDAERPGRLGPRHATGRHDMAAASADRWGSRRATGRPSRPGGAREGPWTGRLRQPRHPRPASGTADRRIRLQRARPARRSQRREDHRLAASAPARAARQRYWRPPPLRYYHCDVHLGECAFGAPLVRPSANRAPMGPRAVGLATAAVGLKARWRPARQVVTGLAATGTAQRARRGRRRAAAATGRPCAGTRL